MANNCGTIFKITATGALTTLHTLEGTNGDGSNPNALVQDTNKGTFYGTTLRGGKVIYHFCAPSCGSLCLFLERSPLRFLGSRR
jgi:hypothetical protein